MAPEHVASNLALFGFGVSSLFFLWMAPRLDAWHEAIALRRVGFTFLVGATLAATYSALKSMGLTPISDLTGILLAAVLGWMAVSGHIILKLRLISAVIAPVITLILLLQFFVAPSPRGMVPMTGEETSLLVGIHVLTAVIGQAFAIVACAIAAFYLWLQRLLKRRRLLDLPPNLPAIDRTANLLTTQLWAGFLFLTLGLLSGAIYVRSAPTGLEMVSTVKVLWAIGVWVWYFVTLAAQNLGKASSKRVAQMALLGALILAATYFGMGFWRGGAW